jgi:outer membrane lipoprotein carrier protein
MFNLIAALMMTLVAAPSGSDARSQLEAFAAGLETLSGRFEQTTVDADGRTVERSRGRLYFSDPDRFRWDYEGDFPQQIVADGERLWHYDEALEQVSVSDQPPPSESPLLVLTEPSLLDRFYRIAAVRAGVIEFEPRGDAADFERGRLYLDDGVPQRLELEDTFGQLTRISLSELERNPALRESLFEFEVPEGVDVLEGY